MPKHCISSKVILCFRSKGSAGESEGRLVGFLVKNHIFPWGVTGIVLVLNYCLELSKADDGTAGDTFGQVSYTDRQGWRSSPLMINLCYH